MRTKIAILTIAAIVSFTGPLSACTTPVFIYALDVWEPDYYEVIVFHREPLSPENTSCINLLRKAESNANITTITVNLAETSSDEFLSLYQTLSPPPELPRIVLRYPRRLSGEKIVWTGPLSRPAVERLIDSPGRREIIRRIREERDSAVWLLLESGNKEKDEAAAQTLKGALARAETTLNLSEPVAGYKVAFSRLRLSRDEPPEEIFVSMLLQNKSAGGPFVFAVFGRGRAILATSGENLSEELIIDMCAFILGECACEFKAMNPGFDLIMRADWEKYLENLPRTEEVLPPLTGVFPDSPAPASFGRKGQIEVFAESRLVPSIIILLGAAGILVIAASFLLCRRRKKKL